MKESCETCTKGKIINSKQVECRANAPKSNETKFPIMNLRDWCNDYTLKGLQLKNIEMHDGF